MNRQPAVAARRWGEPCLKLGGEATGVQQKGSQVLRSRAEASEAAHEGARPKLGLRPTYGNPLLTTTSPALGLHRGNPQEVRKGVGVLEAKRNQEKKGLGLP